MKEIFMKTKNEIFEQLYMTADDLLILIPELKYQRALDIINEVRDEMKNKKYYIPISRKKLALTKLVLETLGVE